MTHPIPFAALDGKVGVMGLTGSGKTFTAIGMVEQLLDAGRQVIVVDPTGVYNGLRTAFSIPIFGGKFGDIPITDQDGEAVAHAIIDGDLSAIVDVSLLLKASHASARRFMKPFAAALKDAPTRARYLVMDEADEFMPENANGDTAELFGDLKWIVRRGRSEGWRMLMVTQRPQDIAKSVLTQCETMVIHRLSAPQDRKALLEWVKGNAGADVAAEVFATMATLGTGEAWVWSPGHNLIERVQMPANRSEDRSKTPDADDAPRAALGFKPVDLAALKAALAKPEAMQLGDGVTFTEAALSDAKAALHYEKQLSDLRGQLAAMTSDRDHWRTKAYESDRKIDAIREMLIADEIPAQGGGGPTVDEGQTEGRQVMMSATPRPAARPVAAETAIAKPSGGGNASPGASDLTRGARAMIDALARFHPRAMSTEHVAKAAGVSTTSSAWRANLNSFSASPWVERFHNSWRISPEGVSALRLPDKPSDPNELREFWLGSFPPSTAAMLRVLIGGPEHAFGRNAIAERAGVSPTSSGLGSGLRELLAHNLIVKRGDLYSLGEALK